MHFLFCHSFLLSDNKFISSPTSPLKLSPLLASLPFLFSSLWNYGPSSTTIYTVCVHAHVRVQTSDICAYVCQPPPNPSSLSSLVITASLIHLLSSVSATACVPVCARARVHEEMHCDAFVGEQVFSTVRSSAVRRQSSAAALGHLSQMSPEDHPEVWGTVNSLLSEYHLQKSACGKWSERICVDFWEVLLAGFECGVMVLRIFDCNLIHLCS